MTDMRTYDDDRILRIPLYRAQLYRRAQGTYTPLERHQTADDLWEAGQKRQDRSPDERPRAVAWDDGSRAIAAGQRESLCP